MPPTLAEAIQPKVDAAHKAAADAWANYESLKDKFTGDANDAERPEFTAVNEAHKAYVEAANEFKRLEAEAGQAVVMDAGFGPGQRPEGDDGGPSADDSAGRGGRTDMRAVIRKLMASDEYRSLKASGHLNSRTTAAIGGNRLLGEGIPRDAVMNLVRLGSASSAGALVVPDQAGYLDLPRRKLTLLDVIPTGTTDTSLIEYVRQLTRPTSADFVAETTNVTPGSEDGLKPQGTISWERIDVGVKTLAELVPATRQALSDFGQLLALITGELVYDLRRKLEDEVYTGDDATTGFEGLQDQANNSYTRGTTDPDENIADAIHRGITLVELDNYEVDFIGMSPATWEKIRLAKDANDNYYFGPPSMQGDNTIWGYDRVISQVIPDDEVIVGARRGAQMWLNGGVEIFVGDQHKDWMQRNVIALLAELRAAFLVTRPDAFAIVDVSDPA